MTDRDEFLKIVSKAIAKEDENQFNEALDVIDKSLSGPQRYIFEWILKEMARVQLTQENIIKDLDRKIEELQKQLTFKGVPDDGC